MSLRSEISQVIDRQICVGCGACAVVAPNAIKMVRDSDGAMVARVVNDEALTSLPSGVCPFNNYAPNEDAHSERLWPNMRKHPSIGRFASCWAGHVVEGDFRAKGSSGGLTSWLAAEILKTGFVKAVLHVYPRVSGQANDLFYYSISRTPEEVSHGAKSRYFSVSMDAALREVLTKKEDFAFIGVPCYIKAVRNLACYDPEISKRLKLCLSLICGHMKASSFAESLAWQLGVPPGRLQNVDFRVKLPGRAANSYGFSAISQNGNEFFEPMTKLAGRSWDAGYHRLRACDYCDDVFGETADVTLGDAWLPPYSKDFRGTNVIVARNPMMAALLENAHTAGRLKLDGLDVEPAARSQAGGLRDRRVGLAYRLLLDEKRGRWCPTKRVTAADGSMAWTRKLSFRLRRIVRERSFKSFQTAKKLGTISLYKLEMQFWQTCLQSLRKLERSLPSFRNE